MGRSWRKGDGRKGRKGDRFIFVEKAAYYYHFDNLGSTIAITNQSGAIVNKYAYDAFGKVLSQVEGISNPFKFVGAFGVMDEGNGLLYMRARYYDPSIGRFISKDPIGWAGGLNLYGYTGNNPVNFVDPAGLMSFIFNAGGHVPIVPGFASGGYNISSEKVDPYTSNASWVANDPIAEAVVGSMADIGVNAGIADLSGTGGKCAGGTINIGVGRYSGIQITLRKDLQWYRPSTWIDAVTVGLGLGVSLPVSYTVPLR